MLLEVRSHEHNLLYSAMYCVVALNNHLVASKCSCNNILISNSISVSFSSTVFFKIVFVMNFWIKINILVKKFFLQYSLSLSKTVI